MARRLTTLLAVPLLALASCGGDGSDPIEDPPRIDSAKPPPSNSACRRVHGHPIRVTADPIEGLVACSARDGTSLNLRNASSQVLRVRAEDRYDRTRMDLVRGRREPPGLDAAHSMTGGGLDARRETLVLPLGASAVATRGSTVSVAIEGDFDLTVAANVARYLAEWIASALPIRGEQLVRPVRACAASVRGAVAEGGYVEDALRHALDTRACRRVIDDVARENDRDPVAERPKARAEILRRARPVLRDRLQPRRATVLAAR